MTLTKADMVDHLVLQLDLTHQQAKMIVDKFFEELSQSLINGKEVKLSGFGNFELKDKGSRPGRNPKTGELVQVSARRVVTFKAGQKFRQKVEDSLSKDSLSKDSLSKDSLSKDSLSKTGT